MQQNLLSEWIQGQFNIQTIFRTCTCQFLWLAGKVLYTQSTDQQYYILTSRTPHRYHS